MKKKTIMKAVGFIFQATFMNGQPFAWEFITTPSSFNTTQKNIPHSSPRRNSPHVSKWAK